MAVNPNNMFWAIPVTAGNYEEAYKFLKKNNVVQPIHPDSVISQTNLTGNTAEIEGDYESSIWFGDKVFLTPENLLAKKPAVRLQMLQAGHLLLVFLKSIDFPAFKIYISNGPHTSHADPHLHVRFDVELEGEAGEVRFHIKYIQDEGDIVGTFKWDTATYTEHYAVGPQKHGKSSLPMIFGINSGVSEGEGEGEN